MTYATFGIGENCGACGAEERARKCLCPRHRWFRIVTCGCASRIRMERASSRHGGVCVECIARGCTTTDAACR